MSDFTNQSNSVTPISTRSALWKSFLTVSVVLPWGMIACLSIFLSGVAMGTGSNSDNYLIRSAAPFLPAILLWFAYSLGVSISTKRRGSGIIIGLFLGWLLLSIWSYETMPNMILKLFSPKNDEELLKAVLTSYILAAGWLVSFGLLLCWLNTKIVRTSRQPGKRI